MFAKPDHAVSSRRGRALESYPPNGRLWRKLRHSAKRQDIRFFDLGEAGQGIVHVMAQNSASCCRVPS